MGRRPDPAHSLAIKTEEISLSLCIRGRAAGWQPCCVFGIQKRGSTYATNPLHWGQGNRRHGARRGGRDTGEGRPKWRLEPPSDLTPAPPLRPPSGGYSTDSSVSSQASGISVTLHTSWPQHSKWSTTKINLHIFRLCHQIRAIQGKYPGEIPETKESEIKRAQFLGGLQSDLWAVMAYTKETGVEGKKADYGQLLRIAWQLENKAKANKAPHSQIWIQPLKEGTGSWSFCQGHWCQKGEQLTAPFRPRWTWGQDWDPPRFGWILSRPISLTD